MYESTFEVRVRYAETDQMGVVYYGNYAQYYEIARTEAMRKIGLPYTELEKRGVIMPVVEMSTRYKRAAKYDMLLTIKTKLKEVPNRTMEFFHEIFDEQGNLLNKGTVKLMFVDQKTGSVVSAPQELKDGLKVYF